MLPLLPLPRPRRASASAAQRAVARRPTREEEVPLLLHCFSGAPGTSTPYGRSLLLVVLGTLRQDGPGQYRGVPYKCRAPASRAPRRACLPRAGRGELALQCCRLSGCHSARDTQRSSAALVPRRRASAAPAAAVSSCPGPSCLAVLTSCARWLSAHLGKESCEGIIVILTPSFKWMVMALGTLHSYP